MELRTTSDRAKTMYLVFGAVAGLVLGILVSLTTDIPLAPEAGLLVGAAAGWFSHAARRS